MYIDLLQGVRGLGSQNIRGMLACWGILVELKTKPSRPKQICIEKLCRCETTMEKLALNKDASKV